MSYKYRLYCITDSRWEYIWNNVDPGVTVSHGITECPTNNGHTINPNSISDTGIIEKQKYHINTNLNIKKKNLSTINYTDVNKFIFEGMDSNFKLTNFNIVSSMNQHSNGKIGDIGFEYTIRIYDKTNRNIICSQQIQGNPLEAIAKSTTGLNIPTTESIFAVQILLGSKGGDINIDNIDLIFKK